MLHMLTVWLHVVAAIVWIGGMAFSACIFLPLLRRRPWRERAAALPQLVHQRFRGWAWVCLALLLVTGIANLSHRVEDWSELATVPFWSGLFGGALAFKLLLVLVIFELSVLHDFGVGARALTAWQTDPESPESQRLWRITRWLAHLRLFLALVILALAVAMVRG